jgi:surface polysaccharide O-acyltransferase-like enzyme
MSGNVCNNRNTSLDLMRIVCMFMVLSLHYFGEGGILESADRTTFNAFLAGIMVVLCRGAVNCFYMNSGYFLPTQEENARTRKTIRFPDSFKGAITLYKQVWIYSILVFVVAIVFNISAFSLEGLARAVLPILGNQYWFVTVFILITLLRPFLMRLTTSLMDKEVLIITCLLFFFDSVQAVFGVNVLNESGNGFLHALTMVFLGHLIRRNCLPKIRPYLAITLYLFVSIALVGGVFVNRIPNCPIDYWKDLMVYNSPFVIAIAFFMFSFFNGIEVKNSFFSKVSGSVFAAYLIQDHSAMRANFWKKIVHTPDFWGSNYLILHYFISVMIILCGAICVDFFFKLVIKKVGNRIQNYNEV